MAILAYLSGRCAALRGAGMRSNFADSFRATHLQSGLRTQAHPLENRAPIAQTSEPSQRAPNRTGTVAHDLCAGPVRTTFAHDLCASYLSNISLLNLWLGHYHDRFQCCTRGGQNGGSDPPRLRIPLGSGPPWLCASRGSGASLPTGGRSRHSDPCRKARIAEG